MILKTGICDDDSNNDMRHLSCVPCSSEYFIELNEQHNLLSPLTIIIDIPDEDNP